MTEESDTGLTLSSVYLGMVMKTVLVTGGGRGLGRATAEKLAVLGHRVILVARNPVAADAAVKEILHSHSHVRVEARSVDLSSLTQVRAFATTEADRGEPIDVLFHIAATTNTIGAVIESRSRRPATTA